MNQNLDVKKILEGCGISTEAYEKIKFPQGVVGKTSLIVAMGLVVLAIIAMRTTSQYLLVLLFIAVVVLVVWHCIRTREFAEKNPALALTEGAELLAYRKIELGAKDFSNPPQQILTDNPSDKPLLTQQDILESRE